VAVLIPEADFLSDIGQQRNLALSAIVGGGVLTAVLLVVSTVRRVRQQLKRAVSQIERKLGQYRLKYKIGGGGNGDVYLARHALLRRPTAIKIMRPEFARSESAKARFEHEVQITSGLTHPNTVAIYDFGKTPEDTLYYAMELLTGYTLDRLVRAKGPLSAARVIHILDQVCGSLAEAHGKDLIHRDVKPANIMLCERGGLYDVVKVLDFGLVKETGGDDPQATQVNVLVGTPHYMAPEVISAAGRASPASDLYALGAVAYYLLTGYHVFEGASTVEICAKHLHDAPLPPSLRGAVAVPGDLEALVLSCLEKDPPARPASAEALAERLRACADYGGWSPQDAKTWWRANQYELPLGEESGEHTPLSNTELLVDMDERLERLRRTVGQTAV
jgi:serine/threonine-protein kinase